MAISQTGEPSPRKPLRVWPGLVIVALQLLLRWIVPAVAPEATIMGLPTLFFGVMAGLVLSLAILVWWVFFSRATWPERLGAVVLMAIVLAGTRTLLHDSLADGMMGMLFFIYAVPVLSLAFVAWAVATRNLADGPRRAAMAATILLACAPWLLLRTGGITGDANSDFQWRWTQTAEERLLAQDGNALTELPAAPDASAVRTGAGPAAPPPAPAAAETTAEQPVPQAAIAPAAIPAAPASATKGAEWPGFRGPQRDGVVRGVRIQTDWSASPPVELWRRPIGPGWSSFAVHGNRFFTQEQRGEDEVVSCYNLTTGEPVWGHRDAARFWESNGGAGPRGTPTLSNGRVYTLGATGILNALDAEDGSLVWTRNAASDTGAETPGWGFAASPLVIGDTVLVATSGKLASYDVVTGKPRWIGPDGGDGYSSPHLSTIGGVPQVLLLSGAGATSVAPADGTVLWQHPWKTGTRIVQPAQTADGDVLIGSDSEIGRVAVTKGPGGWSVEERWTSNGLKPYFNDFVVHKGHAFGFDGSRLSCIDLESGKRKWKDGHYGHGQLLLLADQDLLLVLSEKGELALVGAHPEQFTELARRPAIEGKTWNHPVLAGDILLVRNGEEMVAFRLALASR